MKVPLLDLTAQHQILHTKLLGAIERVIRSNHFILGPEVDALETSIAAYSQAKFAVGVSSGTDALLLALMALDIGPGDEVITTPFSFFATASSIVRVGAKAVFVDIDPLTYNINPALVERAITPKTRAILPVHLYGQMADMAPLVAIARKHHIFIIEDAAQALGAEYRDGERAGSMGDVGCFSFFPTKNLGALGDAGIATAQDPELAEKMRILRVHGSHEKYYHRYIGGNFRIDALQAAVLRVKFELLDLWTKQRQENAKRYDTLLSQAGLSPAVIVPPRAVYKSREHGHIYNQYVIRTQKRDALRAYLEKENIGTEVYYPLPLHLQDCFKPLGYQHKDFPEAERAAQETLALPVYPGITPDQQDFVVKTIRRFYGQVIPHA